MSTAVQYNANRTEEWHALMDVISRAAAQNAGSELPIVLTSLPELPEYNSDGPAICFVHGPPGRNIAIATGLRAALPDIPLLLIMNADAVTLGMNHLIHAARRNMDMTLLILRAEVTDAMRSTPVKRTDWHLWEVQESIERKATPLELATDLGAASVARGSLEDADNLAELISLGMQTPGFSMIGVTSDPVLPHGVLSRNDLPSYFDCYENWATSLRTSMQQINELSNAEPLSPEIRTIKPPRVVPRHEIRIEGIGGHGVKLAGSVLAEAAGNFEGLWTTVRGEYGSATRGGPSLVDVVAGSDRISYPGADNPDVRVVLAPGELEFTASTKPSGVLIVDANQVQTAPEGVLAVPIIRISIEHTGKALAAGIVSLGCIAAVTDLVSLNSLKRSLALKLPSGLVEQNIAALTAGYETTCKLCEGESHG